MSLWFSGPLGTFSSGISRVPVSLDYSKQHLPHHRRSFVSSFPPPLPLILNFCLYSYILPGSN
ncbi:hypothetical protein N7516_007007 [Penicillium verrucosum]|uniref:uncharacterized protein n=1 Tax=Penicillium verrucosum TaxID=60171 RepID=UPI0025454EA1|nr:uncharacterized protein N7516_007007 [Penicillium verrucosum]KAJ5932518.1 hypothetical protein N7516_007007 [Penicillium verrucosum]